MASWRTCRAWRSATISHRCIMDIHDDQASPSWNIRVTLISSCFERTLTVDAPSMAKGALSHGLAEGSRPLTTGGFAGSR